MKPTEIEPLRGGKNPSSPGSDRLTQFLIWAAFFLLAAVAALVVDLWLRPAGDGLTVQAVGPAPTQDSLVPTMIPYTQTPVPLPTETPTQMPEPTIAPTDEPTPTPVPPTVTEEPAAPTPVTPPACIPPDDWGIHVVQLGNTLYSLAQRYNTSVETLMRVNCLNTHTLFVNQRLYVPGHVATPTIPSAAPTRAPLPTATRRPGASATPSTETVAQATPNPTATPKLGFQINIPNNYLNIVLLGSDKRPTSGAWRTDSMIVVSVDTQTNVVRLLSIPRDLWVYIPGHGYNRINTADLWGELDKKGTGPDRVKQTIYQNLGIPIHYYVRVDFKGFMQIVDTVGGVDIDVDCPLPDIKLAAGMHHMDGQQALRYARSRKSTNDFDRGRRQRKVLLALWDQALTMNIIPKLPDLWRSMSNSFQTDLPLNQVINLAYVGVQLKPQHIMSRAIGPSHVRGWMTPQGASVLLPQEDKIRAMLESFYAPVATDRLDTVDKVSIQVLNGTQRQEAEELAAAALRWAGFKVSGTGLASRQDYAQTKILMFNGDVAAAQKIARELRVSAAEIQDASASGGQSEFDFQVVLGRDYDPCQR